MTGGLGASAGFPTSVGAGCGSPSRCACSHARRICFPRHLVLPAFVREGIDGPVPIGSMPGVVQHSARLVVQAAAEAAEAGVTGVMLFGVPAVRDAIGSGADDPHGILNIATAAVAAEVGTRWSCRPTCAWTSSPTTATAGVLAADGSVDNDATLERYVAMKAAQAC